jgi:hypothetical protein
MEPRYPHNMIPGEIVVARIRHFDVLRGVKGSFYLLTNQQVYNLPVELETKKKLLTEEEHLFLNALMAML